MSNHDPIAVAERVLSAALESDATLMAMLPGGIHEARGFDVPTSPLLLVTWGRPRVFRTFRRESHWYVFAQLSVQGVDGPASALSPAVSRVHELLTSHPVGAVPGGGKYYGVIRTEYGRTLFPSPVTGKRESQSTYRLTVSC